MKIESKILMMVIDHSYKLKCKHCLCSVIDPMKKYRQKYLTDKCPSCGKDGADPVESRIKK